MKEMEKAIEKKIEESCNCGCGGKCSCGWKKALCGVGFAVLGAGVVALIGYVAMLLWNWLVPDIIGWKAINYWQALGLFCLSCIFLGRFDGCGHGKKCNCHCDCKCKDEQPSGATSE